MNKSSKKNIVVLYHENCLDGFCGRWVAWKKFGNRAQYYAVPPRVFPSQLRTIQNATVYVIDNSLFKADIDFLHNRNCKVIILDHHISSKDDVMHADEYLFDVKHSGAMLAWKYFFSHVKAPRLVCHIEDGDLWNFRLSHTDDIRNVLVSKGFVITEWNKIARLLETLSGKKKIISQGAVIEQYRDTLIEKSVENAYLIRFGGKVVYTVNETTESIRSEVAHRLYAKHPPFSVVWSRKHDQYHISIRSTGVFDCSKLAKKYGGGGHKVAAGFLWPAHKPLPWKVV
ncbi:MAG: DHHA1 domain-containing protein [Patescibacteria group bacterium]|nr:DHHA1 domain-containing protein [Patescibacteria group bacterium]